MSAFFTTFVANEPDEDGDIGFDTELTVTNETEQPVYQIQYKIWYRDPGGATSLLGAEGGVGAVGGVGYLLLLLPGRLRWVCLAEPLTAKGRNWGLQTLDVA